ncbi:MAG: hypothetical protein K9N29_04625 [Candidatus Marinimicrobia bacterium]|nr:hypothetical protein [Candidatus Neomarinimicrobiota bacterium]
MLWGVLVLQCDFGLPTKVVIPTWQVTLTIPLVSQNYPFDGLLTSDTTGTIQVYGDSVDTDGDGIMDILLPDTLSDYPGGLYITLENDLPPITLPEDMFVIPGQDPMNLGVGPLDIGSLLPAALETGIHMGPVDTVINMTDMGFNYPPYTNDTIPDASCENPDARRSVTVSFTFGDADTNLNFAEDVLLPGYVHEIEVNVASLVDLGGCDPCPTDPVTYICTDTLYVPAIPEGATLNIPDTPLPMIREAYALLPDPSTLPPDIPIESFESVKISTGSISSVINSQLPLTSSNIGLLVYTKSADGRADTLHNHFFEDISQYMRDGEDSVKVSSLDGVTVFDSLIFEFGGTINSNNGDTLEFPMGVNPFFHYNFSLDIDGFESFQINMRDTTMSIYQDMNTTSPDAAFTVQIVKAKFKDNVDHPDTNRLSIALENHMGLDIDVLRIKLRNFYATDDSLAAGSYEILEFALPDGASRESMVVLDGHILSNLTSDDTPLDSLLIETEIQFSSGGGPTTIPYPPPDEMSIDVQVLMTSLRIEDLVGLFDINFGLSNQEQPLSLPGLVGGVSFGEAILAITMENEFGVSPGLGLKVKGSRGLDSLVVALDPDSVNFQSGSPDAPVSTEIRISRDYVRRTVDGVESIVQHFPADNNIVNLMAMMPDLVSVGGDARITPDGLTSITAGAEISGTWRFEIPFLLSIAPRGVQFMSPTFTEMAATGESTLDQLVGANRIPDEEDMLLSSVINTKIFSDIGLGFEMRILVSDIPYFPFYNSTENKVFVAADRDLDGAIDTLGLDLDTLILHPVVRTLELKIPAAGTDPLTGLSIPGLEGSGTYSHSADFNLGDLDADSTYGTLKHHKYAYLDTFIISRSDSTFTDVASAMTSAGLAYPTVPDSLYNLTLSDDATQLLLMLDTTPYGELGWMIDPKTHYLAIKFIIDETDHPVLLPFSAGIDVTAYMQFILNSGPMFSSSEADTTQ